MNGRPWEVEKILEHKRTGKKRDKEEARDRRRIRKERAIANPKFMLWYPLRES